MTVNYDQLDTTAQRVYKYVLEHYGKNNPKRLDYNAVAEEIGRTRSGVSYAVKVLRKKQRAFVKDGELYIV
ncbi:MAG: hypothetical protein IJ308_08890 [Clostridia bacterium]|nr:hypothetical protein [Clostridia bacterium]